MYQLPLGINFTANPLCAQRTNLTNILAFKCELLSTYFRKMFMLQIQKAKRDANGLVFSIPTFLFVQIFYKCIKCFAPQRSIPQCAFGFQTSSININTFDCP